jgi:hypothetical protein
LLGVLRFPVAAGSRIRSMNHSPLGAASPSIADPLLPFYECAQWKSRGNSETCGKKNTMMIFKNIFNQCA